ncbi:unnamed protein product [Dibothriocephalus latus]|uniref:SH3 domain-containing protein n=1 Tax=Dibothriocephalus latus TaxID=60516 RepID=A0A3P6T6M1_DIBLA|nr:unnamed protein product [Dibothriocephalus latus]
MLSSHIHEHNLAVGRGDASSQVAAHTYGTGYEFNFAAARIIAHAGNKTGGGIIEAWSSDDNSVNRCIELAPTYIALRMHIRTADIAKSIDGVASFRIIFSTGTLFVYFACKCNPTSEGSQATNEFGAYTATTQCSDEKSYNGEAVGGTGSVEVSGRYDFTGICLFEFTAALDDEITIHPGDKITQIHQFDKKWLWGTNPSGKAGRFPKSYVEIFEDDAKNL